MMGRLVFASTSTLTTLIVISLTQVPLAGQAPASAAKQRTAGVKTWTPPRTPDGRPDLQGVWNFATITPLERPDTLAGKHVLTDEDIAKVEAAGAESRIDRAPTKGDVGAYNQFWMDRGTKVVATRQSSLIVDPPDGKLPPFTPAGEKTQAALTEARKRNAGPEDRYLAERCIVGFNAGPPMLSSAYNNLVQLFQIPGYVVILNEMIHSWRIVPTDGRPHGTLRQWSGDSRGRWEGDTLLVDTTNFRDDGIGVLSQKLQGTDQNLHVVERFRRVDGDTLLYEFTVDDPTVWMKPWSGSMPMAKTAEGIFEYACHEGNYGMRGILTGARAEDKAAAEAANKGPK
jgi:hypothetical protein